MNMTDAASHQPEERPTFEDRPMDWGADPGLTLPALIRQRAEETPDATFIEEVDGRSQTYAEFYRSSLRWADALHALGVRPGEVVAAMLPNVLEAHQLWLGCGWLHTPDATLNTAYRGMLLRHALTTVGARIVVTTPELVARVTEVLPEVPTVEWIIVVGDAGSEISQGPLAPPVRILDQGTFLDQGISEATYAPPEISDISSVIFTSGTTGPSKGIDVRWAQMASGIGLAPAELLDPDDGYYLPYPPFHVSGKAPLLWMARARCRVVIREGFSASSFWAELRRYRCTATVLVGSLLHFINWRAVGTADDTPLRQVLIAPSPPDVEEFKQKLGVQVINSYGMTEIGWPFLETNVHAENYDSTGPVRPGYEVRVVGGDDEDVRAGEVGELWVRAVNADVLSAGYRGLPELTAQTRRDGWIRTADAFRQKPDGSYVFVDRIKDAIRRKGENVSSFEVEAYVNAHPAVKDSAAVAVPSEFSEDEIKVCVELADDADVDAAALFAWFDETMPRFMVPRYLEIVDTLPRTPTGKIQKVRLRESGVNANTFDVSRAMGGRSRR